MSLDPFQDRFLLDIRWSEWVLQYLQPLSFLIVDTEVDTTFQLHSFQQYNSGQYIDQLGWMRPSEEANDNPAKYPVGEGNIE